MTEEKRPLHETMLKCVKNISEMRKKLIDDLLIVTTEEHDLRTRTRATGTARMLTDIEEALPSKSISWLEDFADTMSEEVMAAEYVQYVVEWKENNP